MVERISSGSPALDLFLEGGYDKDIITTIYGPAGTGKTLLCMLCAIHADKKVIYVDSEGGFSVERLKQLAPNFKEVLSRILLLNPVNFDEQKRVFERLRKLVDEKISIVIFDSVAMLYRLEIGKTKEVIPVNKELGVQISFLTELARTKKIPVLVTNHVYEDHDDRSMRMVGGDVLRYGSKCLLEVEKAEHNLRRLTFRKHRSIPEGKEFLFRIVKEGIEEVKK